MTKKLFFLKVKKTGGSKESELKSKSLLELVDMMDDVGKWRMAEALRRVDPQQSMGIGHLGLEGYLKKAISLLESGQQLVGGVSLSDKERQDIATLRNRVARGERVSSEGLKLLEELEKKEQEEKEDMEEDKQEEEELKRTSKHLKTVYKDVNSEIRVVQEAITKHEVADEALARLSSLLQNTIGSSELISENVKTLKDFRHIVDARNAEYATARKQLSRGAFERTPHSRQLIETSGVVDEEKIPDDYSQYVENEAIVPLSSVIGVAPSEIESVINAKRYLGFNRDTGLPNVVDTIDFDITKGNTTYAVEVKGRRFNNTRDVGVTKFGHFDKLRKKINEYNFGKPVRDHKQLKTIVMWPKESSSERLTPSGKYYKHIPSYDYVELDSDDIVKFNNPLDIAPGINTVEPGTRIPFGDNTNIKVRRNPVPRGKSKFSGEVTYTFDEVVVKNIPNSRHKSVVARPTVSEAPQRIGPEAIATPEERRRARDIAMALPGRRTANLENAVAVSEALASDRKHPEVERESKEEEPQMVRIAKKIGNIVGQRAQVDEYNKFLVSKGLDPVSQRTLQGYISKAINLRQEFPDKVVKAGLYDYFGIPRSEVHVLPPKPVEKKKVKKEDDSKVLEEASRLVELQKVGIEKARADVDALYVGRLLEAVKPDDVLTLYNLWPERGVKKAKAKDIAGFIKKFKETGRWPEWGFSNFIQQRLK